MKNFFIKIYTPILFSLSIAALHSATRPTVPIELPTNPPVFLRSVAAPHEPIELRIVDDILDAARTPAAKMPIQQCVLDFSRDGAQSSVFKITGYLLSSGGIIGGDSHKKLYWADFSYLMCESLAAWVRQSPADFPKLANFFNDKDAVYTAFGKIINTVDTTERELSALADLKNCESFVKETMDKDLPLLLNELFKALPASLSSVGDLAKDHQSEIVSVAKKFTPQIAQLVNVSYIGLSKASDAASAAVSNFVQAIEDGGCCGCFSLFKSKKK
ncbi:MAG: hypothetical protein NT128_05755 [Proteobacteria bacterium]|nr:hypothetical protein [Pseudomonadota bacterium]